MKKTISLLLALLMIMGVFAVAPITASANQTVQFIDELAVTGATLPVVGANPVISLNDLSVDVEGVTVYNMSWSKINVPKIDNMTSSDVYEESGEYRIRVFLKAESGNKFVLNDSDFPAVSATINGQKASLAKISGKEPSEYICLLFVCTPAPATVLDSIELTDLVEPEDGENPEFTVTAPAGVTVDKMDWQKSGFTFDASETFVGGEKYTARVFLSANPGYKFAVNGDYSAVSAMINGGAAEVYNSSMGDPSEYICVTLRFITPTEMTTIADIEIIDVPEPIPGKIPSYEVTAPWFVDYEAVWDYADPKHVATPLEMDGRFDYNSEYIFGLYLKAKPGCRFAVDEEGEPTVNVTMNGQAVEVTKVHGEKSYKQVWAGYITFKTPMDPNNPEDISTVSFADVAVPRAGDVADTTFSTTTEGISVEGNKVQWWDHSAERYLEEDEKFREGRQYSACFTVTADDCYKFPLKNGISDVASFVNGKAAETHSISGYDHEKKIDIVFDFPTVKKPDGSETPVNSADISNFTITGVKEKTYTGRAITQKITVKDLDGNVLVENTDYMVTYKDNVNVGTAFAVITSAGDYEGYFVKSFNIKQAKNPIKVTAKKSVTAYAGAKTTIKKAVTVKKAQGKVTYKTNNKKVTIKKGIMTIAKGLKKGKTYKVKVTVTAKGDSNYKSGKVVKTIKVKVK